MDIGALTEDVVQYVLHEANKHDPQKYDALRGQIEKGTIPSVAHGLRKGLMTVHVEDTYDVDAAGDTMMEYWRRSVRIYDKGHIVLQGTRTVKTRATHEALGKKNKAGDAWKVHLWCREDTLAALLKQLSQ